MPLRRATFLLLVMALLSQARLALAQAPRPARPEGGNRWALLIGVDDYTEIRRLRFAGNDQRAMAERLVAVGFPQDQVLVLHDKATDKKYLPFRENIERQLELMLGLAEAGDLMMVSFSGHGVQLDGKSYFCAMDTRLDKLRETMIPLESVYDRLSKCKATLKLLLVDACRNDILPAGTRSVQLGRGLGDFGAAQEAPPQGILLLSSCGPGQTSMEDEEFKHGVFMHYVLEGLEGKASSEDGGISLTRLYDYASLETKKYVARKFNGYQTPALRGEIHGPFQLRAATVATTTVGSGVTGPTVRGAANSIGMKTVQIRSGEFLMGSPESAQQLAVAMARYEPRSDWFVGEQPQHRVRISKPFWLGMYAVTVGQFRQFVDATQYRTEAEKDGRGGHGVDPSTGQFGQSPSYGWRNPGFPQTDEHPVVNVSWNDAVAFCQWLSRKEGKNYRLPTEAEWEYACRAGTTTRYWFGDDAEELPRWANVADALFRGKYPQVRFAAAAGDGHLFTAPVGQFRPNPLGLHDMHGNVWQWCADWFALEYYATSPGTDPTGPDTGTYRVLRGGSWNRSPAVCRSAKRAALVPTDRQYYTGFRVARSD